MLGATLWALGRLSLLPHTMSDSRLASLALGMRTSGIPGLSKTHCLTAENCECGQAALTHSPRGLHAASGSSPGPLGDTDLRGTVSVWREGRACARVVSGPRAQAIAESFVQSSFCLLPPQTWRGAAPSSGSTL